MNSTSLEDAPRELRDAMAKLQATPEVQGVLLVGSRSMGFNGSDSDYDLEIIVDDAFYDRLDYRNRLALIWDGEPFQSRLIADTYSQSRSQMEQKVSSLLDVHHWPYEAAGLWYDRDGEIAPLMARLAQFPEQHWEPRLHVHHVDFWYQVGRARKIAERQSRVNYALVLTRAAHAYIKTVFVLNRRWPPLMHWAEQSLARAELALRPTDDVALLEQVLTRLEWEPLQTLAEGLLPLMAQAGTTLQEDRLHQFLVVLGPEYAEAQEQWSRY